VSAHAELAWLLQCVTPVGWLERMIQYKEKSAKVGGSGSVGTGLLTYPVLMAADILLYQADLVPVGEDQRQHLELARDICRRTHDMYCSDKGYKKRMKAAGWPSYPVFTEPNALIVKNTARIMSLTDGTSKMSKSDPSDASRINLLDSPDLIAKKIKSAKTDSVSGIFERDDRPEANNLIGIYAAVQPHLSKEELLDSLSGLTWGTFKPKLTDAIIAHLAPIRTRYHEVRSEQDAGLLRVLADGAAAARSTADVTLQRTRAALGFLATTTAAQR
jgi:tryptophanyl-tRNA synthetase